MCSIVEAYIVRIGPECNLPVRNEVATSKQPHGAIPSVRDIHSVGRGHVSNSLRLAQPGERANSFAVLQIDHAHTVVAQFRDIQSLATGIDGEVIDPAADLTQRDLRFELQYCGLRRHGGAARKTED